MSSSQSSTITVSGDLLGSTTNADLFDPTGTVVLSDAASSQAAPQHLEVMSADLGAVQAGFSNNFAYNILKLAANDYVQLVDDSNNSGHSGPEALYVDAMLVPAGSTLDLNGLHLYARTAVVAGTVINGTITQLGTGGPLPFGTQASGTVKLSGQVDDWTFYARSGQSVSVVVNTGAAGTLQPLSPDLNYAQVQLVDPNGNTIAAQSNTQSGADADIIGAVLTTDGVYHIKVGTESNEPNSTGDYLIATYDATTSTASVVLGQPTNGSLGTSFSQSDWTFTAQANEQIRFDLLASANPNIHFALLAPDNSAVLSGLTASLNLVTLPATGTYTLVATGSSGAFLFRLDQTVQTNLTPGTPYDGNLAGSGQVQLFSVPVSAGQSLLIQLDDPSTADHNELYAKFGSAPTQQSYDYGTSSSGSSPNLIAPQAAPGTWYILVYAESVPTASTFTLLASESTVELTGSSPDHSGNSAPATLTISGAGFIAGTTVSLVAANGTSTYSPRNESIDSYSQITATFPAGLAPGNYSLRVTNSIGSTTQANAFTVSAAGSAELETNLILPSALGRHATATLYIQYSNVGTVAMPAPILVLSNPDNDRPVMTLDQSLIIQGYWSTAIPDGFSTSISILASGATPGILQPGESETVPVYYIGLQQPWDFSHKTVPFDLRVISTGNTTPVDWNSMESSLQPSWINAQAWQPIYSTLVSQIGTTLGGYVQMLDNNAVALGKLGESVDDVGQLWNFAILQANGLSPVSTLASATDASIATPGLSLSFGAASARPSTVGTRAGHLGSGGRPLGRSRSAPSLTEPLFSIRTAPAS